MTREVLPTRRPSMSFEAEWQGHEITVSVGFYPDTGRPGEVFADLTKDGPLAAILDDAACAISIALQCGATPAELAKSMGQLPVMEWDVETEAMVEVLRPASPIGAILNAVNEVARG